MRRRSGSSTYVPPLEWSICETVVVRNSVALEKL